MIASIVLRTAAAQIEASLVFDGTEFTDWWYPILYSLSRAHVMRQITKLFRNVALISELKKRDSVFPHTMDKI
jgi:hypothetical protein